MIFFVGTWCVSSLVEMSRLNANILFKTKLWHNDWHLSFHQNPVGSWVENSALKVSKLPESLCYPMCKQLHIESLNLFFAFFLIKKYFHSFYTAIKEPPLPSYHQSSLPLPWGGIVSRGRSKSFPLSQGCTRYPILGSRLQKPRSCTRIENLEPLLLNPLVLLHS